MLKLTGVKKTYKSPHGVVRALRGVDLEVADGDFVAVMGPSGSGKSTLLSMIGLLSAPTKGSVLIGGRETSGLGERERTKLRSKEIGFVFQFPSLVSTLNVRENVVLPKMLAGAVSDADQKRAEQLLKLVGLDARGEDRSYMLSGGEQRRVALARALMNDPALLLADEPTGALDDETAAEMMELLHKANATGKTVVMVTHDKAMAKRAHRLVQIRDGVMVE
ncbi:lipoprotein-releasing system ATP-binding protein LolD [Tumebacillus algifaecis]|uniref:Lipoprotein-releasing system ATP-binding protein LolD n=1 Tax=Tumebacillus algifaecis TaxID=1214604 RepID=A0A223D068_9BACL|nr:ABC transporter ATP-binding protein [Tumebacillus algifaecis]ASS74931.1 lipoprotein-releasing system ATP-binding protein LolD [Tumebacillus algifaecis]